MPKYSIRGFRLNIGSHCPTDSPGLAGLRFDPREPPAAGLEYPREHRNAVRAVVVERYSERLQAAFPDRAIRMYRSGRCPEHAKWSGDCPRSGSVAKHPSKEFPRIARRFPAN